MGGLQSQCEGGSHVQFLKTILKQVAQWNQPLDQPLANKPIVASKRPVATKQKGDAGEASACAFLQQQGLTLLARNYRSPGRGGGEIDLIMRDRQGTLVFVEVRTRKHGEYGGAAASVDPRKQRRIVLAAQHYLMGLGADIPACRFDVVVLQGPGAGVDAPIPADDPSLEWFRAAFDADGGNG